MAKARSKPTAERKGSVPPEAPKKYSFEDIHAALFPNGPPKAKTTREFKEGIRQYIRKRYADR
jgi:hypothetical protein